MLYWLIQPLGDVFIGFNVFRYLTFRAGLAIATAFFLSLVVGPRLISGLRALQIRQAIIHCGSMCWLFRLRSLKEY